MIGQKLAHFRITAKLGEGGMGEVYRAEDTRLGREVAIKVLPEAFVKNIERLTRFEREARVLATLNHPCIASIYEVGEDQGVHYLVLELASGETLAERLERGAIPIEEALPIALQITHGLEAAHQRGIVHRDLKPANVKVGPGGEVKILDFGLAKAIEGTPGHEVASNAPTATADTRAGAILGTAAYMSPEQARGQSADAQADIWSFGVLLWEMLTGSRPFAGDTVPDILAAVLRDEARWLELPTGTPSAIRRLLRRCLERDSGQRLHHIGDARLEIEDAQAEGLAEEATSGVDQSTAPTEQTFRLTAEICRRFDRETLDPRIIGDEVLYLDNQRRSEVLVCYLPGMGLDHRIFQDTLARSPYRGVALTFYGYEPTSEERLVMSWSDQLILLRSFLGDVVEQLRPDTVIVVGFSLGADTALRFLGETDADPSLVDGILSLGCNLNLETCVFSARLADVASASSEQILPPLHVISESANNLEDWIQVHRYLVEIASKYQANFRVLQSAANAAVEPFRDPERHPFEEWYRYVTGHDIVVRCVQADTEHERAALREIRMRHLDEGSLGDAFHDDDLVVEKGAYHFDLLDSDLIERHLEGLLQSIHERRTGRPA